MMKLTIRRSAALALFPFVATFLALPAAGYEPPSSQEAKPSSAQDGKSRKREKIYDESADAKEQIKAALAKATKENRRVLIQWGANWCGWCYLLHNLFKSDREIQRELLYEYDVVLVDIGRWGKNLDLAERYAADLMKKGVPYLTVLDADGDVVANQESGALVKGRRHDPAKVLAFLKAHRAPYRSAESILSEGLARAREENKRVFLHFGAPWCGWCHRLEDWMAREKVASILGKDFVDVKIDTDRTIGGQDVLKRYTEGKSTGIPWYAIIDPDGSVVVTSSYPTENIGHPSKPAEIAAFAEMLAKATVKITPQELETLKASLTQAREEIEARRRQKEAKSD
jgi:thiol:disulfide interchange protein